MLDKIAAIIDGAPYPIPNSKKDIQEKLNYNSANVFWVISFLFAAFLRIDIFMHSSLKVVNCCRRVIANLVSSWRVTVDDVVNKVDVA